MGKILRRQLGVLGWFGIVLLLVVVATAGFYTWQKRSDDKQEHLVVQAERMNEPANDTKELSKEDTEREPAQSLPVFEEEQLQAVLDQWAGETPGESSVVVADETGRVLAARDAERAYFAASLYKLYVAYFGYLRIDAGLADPDETYLGTRTRMECLDVMVRESDSPCAEKMWAELGKQTLTNSLKEIGILNTSMASISTTASDVARILTLFASGRDLSEGSQAAFFASAKDQIFRDALNKGFSDSLIVYNKIGFNELKEYHDAAIVELPDGRRFIITVLTENVGTRNIAELARRIETVILE